MKTTITVTALLLLPLLFPAVVLSQAISEEEVTLILESDVVKQAFHECAETMPHTESIEMSYVVNENGQAILFSTNPVVEQELFTCFQAASKIISFLATGQKFEITYAMEFPPYQKKAEPKEDIKEEELKEEIETSAVIDEPMPPDMEDKTAKDGKKKKLKPAAFYGMLGLTGALLIGTAVLGIVAYQKHQEYQDTPFEEESKWRDLRDQGEKYNIATDVLLGLTVASVIPLIIIGVFTNFSKSEKKKVSLSPSISPDGYFLSLRSVF